MGLRIIRAAYTKGIMLFYSVKKIALLFSEVCNLSCSYCPIENASSKLFIPDLDNIPALISLVKKRFPLVEEVVVWCGEPLLQVKLLLKIREACSERNLIFSITSTNGTLLSNDHLCSLWAKLPTGNDRDIFLGSSRIISFDGVSLSHNKTRSNSYTKVIDGITCALKHNILFKLKSVYDPSSFLESIFLNMKGIPELYSSFIKKGYNIPCVDFAFSAFKKNGKVFLSTPSDLNTYFFSSEIEHVVSEYTAAYQIFLYEWSNYIKHNDIIFLPPFLYTTYKSIVYPNSIMNYRCATSKNQVYLDVESGYYYTCVGGGRSISPKVGALGNIYIDTKNYFNINCLSNYYKSRDSMCSSCGIVGACFGPCNRRKMSPEDTITSYWDSSSIPKCRLAHSISPFLFNMAKDLVYIT